MVLLLFYRINERQRKIGRERISEQIASRHIKCVWLFVFIFSNRIYIYMIYNIWSSNPKIYKQQVSNIMGVSVILMFTWLDTKKENDDDDDDDIKDDDANDGGIVTQWRKLFGLTLFDNVYGRDRQWRRWGEMLNLLSIVSKCVLIDMWGWQIWQAICFIL